MTDATAQKQAPTVSLAAEPLGRHVVLLGLMGTGKTAVGTQLASALGVRFDDNDSRLTAASGLTPRELRNRDGVVVLHSLEAQHLLGALRSLEPGVVSAAASVVEDGSCREVLRRPEIWAIWLRVEPSTLAARFHREAHRPIYSDDLQGFFDGQLAARGPLYERVSDSVIDTDGLTVSEVVELLLPIVDQHLAAGVAAHLVTDAATKRHAPAPEPFRAVTIAGTSRIDYGIVCRRNRRDRPEFRRAVRLTGRRSTRPRNTNAACLPERVLAVAAEEYDSAADGKGTARSANPAPAQLAGTL